MTPEEETFITLQEPAPIVDEDGNKIWFNKNEQTHRENDLPAFVSLNGYMAWYKNGKRHRENDLPAIIWANGDEEYWENGKQIK